MLKNKVLKKVLSGMLVLAFLLQPMSFQAQEDLTKEATNVNILVQEPMNALFQQEAGKDATVENLEYGYSFDIVYVDIKFAAAERANFDKATGGMPIVFSLDERDSS